MNPAAAFTDDPTVDKFEISSGGEGTATENEATEWQPLEWAGEESCAICAAHKRPISHERDGAPIRIRT